MEFDFEFILRHFDLDERYILPVVHNWGKDSWKFKNNAFFDLETFLNVV